MVPFSAQALTFPSQCCCLHTALSESVSDTFRVSLKRVFHQILIIFRAVIETKDSVSSVELARPAARCERLTVLLGASLASSSVPIVYLNQ